MIDKNVLDAMRSYENEQEAIEQQRLQQQQQVLEQQQRAEAQQLAEQTQRAQKQQAITDAAQTTQKVEREEGLVTQVGEGLGYLTDGGAMNDLLNAGAAGLNQLSGGRLQGLDDFVKGDKELEERDLQIAEYQQQVREDGGMSGVEAFAHTTANAVTGLASGIEGGIALPLTVAGRLTNQATPWADAPAVLKDSPVGETVFEIAQVITPTLLSGGVATGLGASGLATGSSALIGESVVETATQDSADDLFFGRTLAGKFGELAEQLGYDGEQLTIDLIEGNKPNAQVINAVVGTFQNLGINFGADKVFRAIGDAFRGAPKPDQSINQIAQVLGTDAESVTKALDDVQTPNYNVRQEPHESISVDTDAPVAKPSKGNEVVSNEALVGEALRRSGIGQDGLTAADRKYFTNWSAVVDDTGLQKTLQEATSTLKTLRDFPGDMRVALRRAEDWWSANKHLLGNLDEEVDFSALDKMSKGFKDEMTVTGGANRKDIAEGFTFDAAALKGFPKQTRDAKGRFGINPQRIALTLREFAEVNEEGFIAASLIGEELGVRLQRLARVAVNLDNASSPIDFTKAVENFLALQDRASLYLIPLRRGKRRWAVEGALQQRRQIDKVKDADISFTRGETSPKGTEATGTSFETIKASKDAVETTTRDLWSAYQAGDKNAGNTLKTYLSTIAYSDPKYAVTQIEDLSQVVKDQLKKGNTDATNQLFYQYMLTRLSPITASAGSNIARLVADPLGAVMTKGTRSYGFGQLVGTWTGLSDGVAAVGKAFKEGRPLTEGTKIDGKFYDLKARSIQEEQLWTQVQKSMNEGNASSAERFGAWMNHNRRMMALNPVMNVAQRGLMATDEGAKVIFASQVATGRAYQEAADTSNWKDIDRLITRHFDNVFKDGVKGGKIIDGDVIAGARHLAFQTDIPTDGNFIDNMFLAAQNATDTSKVWRMFNPFPRLTWGVLEGAGRTLAGSVPGGGTALANVVPRYKAILAGEFGDVAKVQLESQFAFAKGLTASTVGLAGFGFMTGNNSGDMPKRSFIIPAPNTAEGYIAIPYGKLEPYATQLSIIADLVNGVRDDVISNGQYERFLQEMVFSLGMSTLDKGFTSGLGNLAEILDVKNFNTGSLRAIGSSVGTAAVSQVTGATGGLARMVTDWTNPYVKVSRMKGDMFANFYAGLQQRLVNGAGLPDLYNPYNGRKQSKTTTWKSGDNWFGAVASSFVNEVVFPGDIRNAPKDDPVLKQMRDLSFEYDVYQTIQTVDGVHLNFEEQSQLSKDLHDVGDLRGRLERYFKGDAYKRLYNKFKSKRGDSPIGDTTTGSSSTSGYYLERIHRDLRTIHRLAKAEAAAHRVAKTASFRERHNAATGGNGQSGLESVLGIYH